MSDQKMDFREWQAGQKFDGDDGSSELVKDYSERLHILTFGLDRKGTSIVSQISGRIVFVDRDFQYEVAIGDTWVCKLSEGNNCSYAVPLIKVTLNEILNFNENLRENVLSTLWKKHGSDLKIIFENRYKTELQNKIAEELKADYDEKLARAMKERDELENELRQTRFQLEVQSTSMQSGADEYILLGSDDVPSADAKATASLEEARQTSPETSERYPVQNATAVPSQAPVQRGPPQIKRTEPVTQKFEVERTGPDTIRSPSFTDNRYFVHISPDYKLLVIRPNEDGNVYCIGNAIRLKDLGLVSGFTVKKFLVAEYSELYKGMLVRL